MTRRNVLSTLAAAIPSAAALSARSPDGQTAGSVHAEAVYANRHFQPTGISVSEDGRLFVNFPRWSDRYLNAIVAVAPDGTEQPYPDLEWNRWDAKPQTAANHFVCVQSVVADQENTLWVVDAAAPMIGPVIQQGVKLVRIDLLRNQVSLVFPVPPDVALPDSYLNDIRIDNARGFAYLTDSGHGGIIVFDINNQRAWRKLDGHPSVLGDFKVPVIVNGFLLKQPNGAPAIFNADSIELSKDGETLFYKPINSRTLWSIPTAVLRDPGADAAPKVQSFNGNLFPTDGLWIDSKGRLYLTDVENFAVRRLNLDGSVETIFRSERLSWPDTFTGDRSGNIYISASRLHEQPRYHDGYSVRHDRPYRVFRLSGLDQGR